MRSTHPALLLVVVASTALIGIACDPPPPTPSDHASEPPAAPIGITIDNVPQPSPHEYVTYGRWTEDEITWFLHDAPDELTHYDARLAIQHALEQWSAPVALKFREVADPHEAELEFGMRTGVSGGYHGDRCPFAATTIAHAFFPSDTDTICAFGEIHFNSVYPFTTDLRPGPDAPVDYETIVLHEVGHALGLGHSSHPNSVMWAQYTGSRRSLHDDDIQGIQALYGPTAMPEEQWVGRPYWRTTNPTLCATADQTAMACIPSRGLTKHALTFAVLELDLDGATTTALLQGQIQEVDYDPVTQNHITCTPWQTVWQPDGPGHPEYVLQAEVADQVRESPPISPHLLRVGKTTLPTGCDPG